MEDMCRRMTIIHDIACIAFLGNPAGGGGEAEAANECVSA